MKGPWPVAVAEWTPSWALTRDGGGGAWSAAGAGAGGDFVAFHFEEMHAGMERLAHQQLEGAFGGFQFVAFVFHLLDALQQLAAGVFVEAVGQAVLLELVEDVAAAGEVAHQDALAVADEFRA